MELLVKSKVQPDLTLCIVSRGDGERESLSEETEPLQVSILNVNSQKKHKPHAHLPTLRQTDKTQECWVLLRGYAHVDVYDVDDTLVQRISLAAGDVLVQVNGGHRFEAITDDVRMVEIKNGPYLGRDKDYKVLNV